jgi:hypothetical protein
MENEKPKGRVTAQPIGGPTIYASAAHKICMECGLKPTFETTSQIMRMLNEYFPSRRIAKPQDRRAKKRRRSTLPEKNPADRVVLQPETQVPGLSPYRVIAREICEKCG